MIGRRLMSWLFPSPKADDENISQRLHDARNRQSEALKKNSQAANNVSRTADAVYETLAETMQRISGEKRDNHGQQSL